MSAGFPNDENGGKSSDSKRRYNRDKEGSMKDIFRRLKVKGNPDRTVSRDGLAGTKDISKLAKEMQRLGLEPVGLEKFIISLHKLAVASKVDPQALASLIKDLSALSEGRRLSVEQIRAEIRQLSNERAEVAKKVADLQEQKAGLEGELSKREHDTVGKKESFSHFLAIQEQLKDHGVSMDDISSLLSMIAGAAQLGHKPSEISHLLSDMERARAEKSDAEAELERLLDAKRTAQQKMLALEEEVAGKQKLLDSAKALGKLGFEPKDLEEVSSMASMIARTRGIDDAAARQRLMSDLQSYYANDQELRTRLRTLEALVREKEERISMLGADLRNEKAVLENASKLISAGLDEQWLIKLRSIIDAYGSDLDTLAEELRVRKGLSASIDELAKTKRALEEEERLLRQRVVAAEDQRLKTLTKINELIVNTSKPRTNQGAQVVGPIKSAGLREGNQEFLEYAQKAIELIRAKLPDDSPARVVLEHALLALKLEPKRG